MSTSFNGLSLTREVYGYPSGGDDVDVAKGAQMKDRKTKVIVVINQKGGPGKTTVSFHLAHAGLKTQKSRVLCVDLDSQGNLSQYLTGDLNIKERTVGGAGLLFEDVELTPMPTTDSQIDLLHGHKELDRYDADTGAEERAYSGEIGQQLRSLGYNYVVIDTPPAVGLRHLAPLCWADVAVIPMEPSVSGIAGFQDVLKALESVQNLNPSLRWYGVLNRANSSVRSHREKDAWVREQYGRKILATLYSRAAVADAMEESPARPVWQRKGTNKELRGVWRDFCSTVIDK